MPHERPHHCSNGQGSKRQSWGLYDEHGNELTRACGECEDEKRAVFVDCYTIHELAEKEIEMKQLHCTFKVSGLEKKLLFPKLESYCKENQIKCILTGIERGVYRMDASADAETIDDCAKEIARINTLFPGRVSDLKVVFA